MNNETVKPRLQARFLPQTCVKKTKKKKRFYKIALSQTSNVHK